MRFLDSKHARTIALAGFRFRSRETRAQAFSPDHLSHPARLRLNFLEQVSRATRQSVGLRVMQPWCGATPNPCRQYGTGDYVLAAQSARKVEPLDSAMVCLGFARSQPVCVCYSGTCAGCDSHVPPAMFQSPTLHGRFDILAALRQTRCSAAGNASM